MAARISRARIINRKTSVHRHINPAQSGQYFARLTDDGKLTISALRSHIVFKAAGVLAARWESEETLLLIVREEAEDEPVVIRAFHTRTHRDLDTEDARASALVSPNGRFVAVEFSLPNPMIAVLPTGRVTQEFHAYANLGAPAVTVTWSDDSQVLTVQTEQQTLAWNAQQRHFTKTAR